MKNSDHANKQMRDRGIARGDVDAVLAAPEKMAPGDNGATNYWGYGPSGYRVRVTVADDGLTIITVAWADYRKKAKP